MNAIPSTVRTRRRCLAGLAGCLLVLAGHAFPPAPDHVIFGTVRDEQGVPVNRPKAEVWLEANDKVLVKEPIGPGLEPGINYRLAIPVDSGVTGDLYSASAVRPTVPFRLRVRIGNLTYLPIEMIGASHLVTRPGASSRIDLTLGVDSDGDGIPDAWERQLIAALGGGQNIGDIRPGDDADGDGLSNLQEYLAGTYAFDPKEGFNLNIVAFSQGRPVLEFLAIRGRSYSIRASDDLQTWTPVAFNLTTDASGTDPKDVFTATDTRLRRPVVEQPPAGGTTPRFFQLVVH